MEGRICLNSNTFIIDWICNWLGNWESVHAIQYGQSAAFAATPLRPYKANGTAYGEYKVAGNLNWLKVYEAGHEIPYYRKFPQLKMGLIPILT